MSPVHQASTRTKRTSSSVTPVLLDIIKTSEAALSATHVNLDFTKMTQTVNFVTNVLMTEQHL